MGNHRARIAESQAGRASARHAAALAPAIQCGETHEQARARGRALARLVPHGHWPSPWSSACV